MIVTALTTQQVWIRHVHTQKVNFHNDYFYLRLVGVLQAWRVSNWQGLNYSPVSLVVFTCTSHDTYIDHECHCNFLTLLTSKHTHSGLLASPNIGDYCIIIFRYHLYVRAFGYSYCTGSLRHCTVWFHSNNLCKAIWQGAMLVAVETGGWSRHCQCTHLCQLLPLPPSGG